MSFLRNNMKTQIIQSPPIQPTVIDQEETKPVKIKTRSEKKKKTFEIGDDKMEIIQNSISDKPSISELRKALKRYAEISEEEYYENQ